MADAKQIDGLTPDMPAADAARTVLKARLRAVRERVSSTLEHVEDDVEQVHQLRVACRRATAALRIFNDRLPRKEAKAAKKRLRKIRRAAGTARDWDVFLDGLETAKPAEGDNEASRVFLVGYALGHRTDARDALTDVCVARRRAVKDLAELLPRAVKSSRRDAKTTFAEWAAEHFDRLFTEFNRLIAANPTSPEELHQLRIAGKRVRYAMEVFADCYSPIFMDVLYPAVERLQELLGAVQDGTVAIDRMNSTVAQLTATRLALAQQVAPGISAYAFERRKRVTAVEAEFRTWVQEWQDLMAAYSLPRLLCY